MLKKKYHSCHLCKPHKTGGGNRWKAKDLVLLKTFEKTKRDICFEKYTEKIEERSAREDILARSQQYIENLARASEEEETMDPERRRNQEMLKSIGF